MGVAVYCASVVKEYSHFLGAQTPMSTRQAAATRFMLKKIKELRVRGVDFEKRKRTARNCLRQGNKLKQGDNALRLNYLPLISLL